MTDRARNALAFVSGTLTIAACALLLATHGQARAFSDAVPVPVQPTRRAVRTLPVWPHGTVDVNTADAETLCALKGIGPSLAAAIIAAREQDGPFVYPEDLVCVKGIGVKTLARFRDQLDFTGRHTISNH